MHFDEMPEDLKPYLEYGHIRPDVEFNEFVLTEKRPGRQRNNFYENFHIDPIYQFLKREKDANRIF